MQVLNTAAQFHDWEKMKTVVGKFLGPIMADADAQTMDPKTKEPKWKKGDLLGYSFETEMGSYFNVGKNHMIEKSLKGENVGIGCIVGIEYLGKTETAAGNPLTRFKVTLFDGQPNHDGNGWAEALAVYGEKVLNWYDGGDQNAL